MGIVFLSLPLPGFQSLLLLTRVFQDWRIVSVLDQRPDFSKLGDGESGRLRASELLDTLQDRHARHLRYEHHFSDGAVEVVHACREDDASAAKPGRMAPSRDPVTSHALHDLHRILGDLRRRRAKVQPPAKFHDQGLERDQMLQADRLAVHMTLLPHFLVDLAEAEDVGLDDLGDVDEEDGAVDRASAGGIYATGRDLFRAAAAGEAESGDGREQPLGLLAGVVRKAEALDDGRDCSTGVVFGVLGSVAFPTANRPERADAERAGVAGILADEASLHLSRPSGVFFERDFGNDVVLTQLGAAIRTYFQFTVVERIWRIAAIGFRRRRGRLLLVLPDLSLWFWYRPIRSRLVDGVQASDSLRTAGGHHAWLEMMPARGKLQMRYCRPVSMSLAVRRGEASRQHACGRRRLVWRRRFVVVLPYCRIARGLNVLLPA